MHVAGSKKPETENDSNMAGDFRISAPVKMEETCFEVESRRETNISKLLQSKQRSKRPKTNHDISCDYSKTKKNELNAQLENNNNLVENGLHSSSSLQEQSVLNGEFCSWSKGALLNPDRLINDKVKANHVASLDLKNNLQKPSIMVNHSLHFCQSMPPSSTFLGSQISYDVSKRSLVDLPHSKYNASNQEVIIASNSDGVCPLTFEQLKELVKANNIINDGELFRLLNGGVLPVELYGSLPLNSLTRKVCNSALDNICSLAEIIRKHGESPVSDVEAQSHTISPLPLIPLVPASVSLLSHSRWTSLEETFLVGLSLDCLLNHCRYDWELISKNYDSAWKQFSSSPMPKSQNKDNGESSDMPWIKNARTTQSLKRHFKCIKQKIRLGKSGMRLRDFYEDWRKLKEKQQFAEI